MRSRDPASAPKIGRGAIRRRIDWFTFPFSLGAKLMPRGLGDPSDELGAQGHDAYTTMATTAITVIAAPASAAAGGARSAASAADAEAALASRGKSTGPSFDPAKLARIVQNLEKEGATFVWDDPLLDASGADGRYVPKPTRGPGTIYLRSNPTRATVIEELLHLGQHRSTGFDPAFPAAHGGAPQVEMAAQMKLLGIESIEWTASEVNLFFRNWNVWRGMQ